MRTRISGNAGAAVAATLIFTTLLAWGPVAPRGSAAVVPNARESICGASAPCRDDPAPPVPPDLGDQPTAEQRVIEGYTAKQHGCTPDTPPNPKSVTWDPPGFAERRWLRERQRRKSTTGRPVSRRLGERSLAYRLPVLLKLS